MADDVFSLPGRFFFPAPRNVREILGLDYSDCSPRERSRLGKWRGVVLGTSDRRVMAVAVQTGSTFQAGRPVELFVARQPYLTVLADGQRFLAAIPAEIRLTRKGLKRLTSEPCHQAGDADADQRERGRLGHGCTGGEGVVRDCVGIDRGAISVRILNVVSAHSHFSGVFSPSERVRNGKRLRLHALPRIGAVLNPFSVGLRMDSARPKNDKKRPKVSARALY